MGSIIRDSLPIAEVEASQEIGRLYRHQFASHVVEVTIQWSRQWKQIPILRASPLSSAVWEQIYDMNIELEPSRVANIFGQCKLNLHAFIIA